jgi:hypothetical protein
MSGDAAGEAPADEAQFVRDFEARYRAARADAGSAEVAAERTRTAFVDGTDVAGADPAAPDDAAPLAHVGAFELAWARARVRAALFGGSPDATVGRYVLRAPLGAGALWSAVDPAAAREVILAILDDTGATDADRRREDAALPRLRLTELVAVEAVVAWEGMRVAAMERIEAQTLRGWLAQQPRTTAEVMAILEGAARALAGAHAAELVHGELSPDTVLVDATGIARVGGFRLAREGFAPRPAADVYLAPERWSGGRATPLADQFGFCATFHEAFFGHPPFTGETPKDLAKAIAAGRLRVERAAHAPRGNVALHVRNVLRRGLAAKPARRYPSMRSLTAALRPAKGKFEKAAIAVGIVLVVLAAIGFVGAREKQKKRAAADRPAEVDATCGDADDGIDRVWSARHASALSAAVAASGRPFAVATAKAVEAQLDTYAEAWRTSRRTVCRETRVEHAQPAAVEAARMACLDVELHVMGALVERLSAAPAAELVERAAEYVWQLRPPAQCMLIGPRATRDAPPSDPAAARRVADQAVILGEAHAAFLVGAYDEALAQAQQVIDDSVARHSPFIAEAQMVAGRALFAAGNAGDELLGYAYDYATATRDDVLAARAAMGLAMGLAPDAQSPGESDRWLGLATALVDRTHDDHLAAELAHARAHAAAEEHDYAGAATAYAEASAGWRRIGDLVSAGLALQAEAVMLDGLARPADALARLRAAEEALAQVLGPEHPVVGSVLEDQGVVQSALGELDAAIAAGERALAIALAAYPADVERVADTRALIAVDYYDAGRWADVKQQLDRVLVDLAEQLRDSAALVAVLTMIAVAEANLGLDRDADQHLASALELAGELYEDDAVELVPTIEAQGAIALRRNKTGVALAAYRRALAIGREAWGEDAFETVTARIGLARALLAKGGAARAKEAEQLASLAAQSADSAGAPTSRTLRAIATFEWVRARWVRGERSDLDLATTCAGIIEEGGLAYAWDLAQAKAWLATR